MRTEKDNIEMNVLIKTRLMPKAVIIGSKDEVSSLFPKRAPLQNGVGFTPLLLADENIVLWEISSVADKPVNMNFTGAAVVVYFRSQNDDGFFSKVKKQAGEKNVSVIAINIERNADIANIEYYTPYDGDNYNYATAERPYTSNSPLVNLKDRIKTAMSYVITTHRQYVENITKETGSSINAWTPAAKKTSAFRKYIEKLKKMFADFANGAHATLSGIFSKNTDKNPSAKKKEKQTQTEKRVEYSA